MSFCSRECIASGEPRAGTGVRGQAYVFLPVAKRLWGRNEFNDRWAAPEALAAIRAARQGGVITRLYNPQPEAGLEAVLVYTPAGAASPDALAALLELVGRKWPVVQDGAPRLAVCTQGTRERCCAKWGFKVFRDALAHFQAGASPFQPLECSHLGGDRFAATGIVFPSGSMYAHLDTADLQSLGAAEATGQLVGEIYRGRVYEAPLAQIVRAGLARDGLFTDATAELVTEELAPNELRVRAGGRSFRVQLGEAELRFYGSCDKLDEHKRSHARRIIYESGRPEPAATLD